MKHLFITLSLGLLPLGLASADNYTLDPGHTYPSFEINHLGFSTMRGRFNSSKGTMTLDQGAKKASVEVVIDASSVDTGHQKRDDHLRSPDFLNTAEFPEITFKSTKVTFNGDMPSQIDGNLTILGVSKPVRLTVSAAKCGPHPFNKKPICGFDAHAKIKRTDFGINYGIPAIGDEMTLHFGVEAEKK